MTYVLVQCHLPNRDQRELLMRPDLGDIEHRQTIILSLMRLHDLDKQTPGWTIPTGDRAKQLPGMEVRVRTRKSRGLFGGYIPYSLQRTKMELAILEGSVGSNELERMHAKGCYTTNRGWDTTGAEQVD